MSRAAFALLLLLAVPMLAADCTYERIYQDSDCMLKLNPKLHARLNGTFVGDDLATATEHQRRRVWIEPYASYARATAQNIAAGERSDEAKAVHDLAVSCMHGFIPCWRHHVTLGMEPQR